MTVKSSVSLSDAQFAFAKSMVEAGQASSVSGVLQQGVELLQQRERDANMDRQALREILQARQVSATEPASAFDNRLTAMLDRKRAALGLDT